MQRTEEGCRLEHEVPPSTANLYETIPPTLVIPVPFSEDSDGTRLAFVQKIGSRSTEIKYVKKEVVVEDVDMFSSTR